MIKAKHNNYQQTEVGLIPEDWEVKSLIHLLYESPKYGINASAVEFNYNLPTYVRITDINEDGSLDKQNLMSVDHQESQNFFLEEGDLVLARTGASVGKSYLYNLGDGKLVYAGFLIKVKPNKRMLLPSYLKAFLSTQTYWNWIKINSMRSGQPGINGNEYGRLPIPLPPTLAEQKAIATALSDADELIADLEKLIAKKKAIKEGAMQELLRPPQSGGKRLPGFDGEWEDVILKDVIKVSRGGSPRPIQDFITEDPEGINWIKIGDTSSSSKYIVSAEEKIIPEGASRSRKVNKGDFLLSNSMSFGRPYILKIDGCIHDGWLVLYNYEKDFVIDFLYYSLISNYVLNQYLQKASGSSVLNLNKEIVKTVMLRKPKSLNEQKAIAQILSEMDEEIEALEQKKVKYEQVKQGMMQKLLTGKTRLV